MPGVAKLELEQTIAELEQAIATDPAELTNYWQLGLTHLIHQQEDAAQATWFAGLMAAEDSDNAALDLTSFLDAAATAVLSQADVTDAAEKAWLMRQHLREIAPQHCGNLLQLIILSAQLHQLCEEDLTHWSVLDCVQMQGIRSLPLVPVDQVIAALLDVLSPTELVIEIIAALGEVLVHPQQLMSIVVPKAIHLAYSERQVLAAIALTELFLKWDPGNTEAMAHLASFYQNAQMHDRGIATARERLQLTTHLPDKAFPIIYCCGDY